MKNYEFPGAIHIHSTFSDGTESVEKIIKIAQKAGLRWLILTDHNTLKAKELGMEGFYDDLCLLVGEEISPPEGNHYLAMDIQENISPDLSPERFIQEVNNQGGFGFIAHPDERTDRKNDYPPLRWDNWDITGFQGIEIWNQLSDWVDTLDSKNGLYKVFFPNKTLTAPSQRVLDWWDRLNSNSKDIVPGIFGVDAHALHKYVGPLRLKILSYEEHFKSLLNYVFLQNPISPNFEEAKKQIYTALKNGNNIMVNRFLRDPHGIVFTASSTNTENKCIKSCVGEIHKIHNNFDINIYTPVHAKIILYKNGIAVKEDFTSNFSFNSTEPGSYRFEAYLKNKLWIVSNPIKVVTN